MGKRKFTFVVWKNSEKLKKPKKLVVSIPLDLVKPPSLTVQLPIAVYLSAKVDGPRHLFDRLVATNQVPPKWSLADRGAEEQLMLYKLIQPVGGISCTVTVDQALSWTVCVGESVVSLSDCALLRDFCQTVSSVHQLIQLLAQIDEGKLCIGNPNPKFFDLQASHKGIFKNSSGTQIIARYDSRLLPSPTIRHCHCSILLDSEAPRCLVCSDYRRVLHAMMSRTSTSDKTVTSSHANYRYLTTPEKVDRLRHLHKENRTAKLKIQRMKEKLSRVITEKGVSLDEETTEDLHQVMVEEEKKVTKSLEPGSFPHIFWEQQKEASARDKRGMRWHPAMIKWCIFLRHQSSKAYETIRKSGCISLPSERTLQDYTQCVKSSAGFSTAVDHQLMQVCDIANAKPWEKLVGVLIDEMYIRQDLVYEKRTGKLVGYTSFGEINNHLLSFEKSVNAVGESDDADDPPEAAKTMMVFMVRGLFTRLRYPYAQFPCSTVTGELLYQPFWETVFRLERMELKVLATTFDGASVNRRLVKLHSIKKGLIFKTRNLYSTEDRDMLFISDVCHLIKTVRNCWQSSARSLWNNGQYISWSHLVTLYEKDLGKASGLAMVPKLTYEHLHLNSFAKMRVDLAAQVLSESVSKALPLVVGSEATETAKFVGIFDKFFDLLNVRNFVSGVRYRKPFLHPYHSASDERVKWLKETFLPYLDAWESNVSKRPGFTPTEKKRMLLSDETMLGLRMTANSFIQLIETLFAMPTVVDNRLSFLSFNLCQDPLEGFFGCQRQRGRTSENPSVKEFYQNTAALRVVNSFCRNPTTGNCRGSKGESSRRVLSELEVAPLPRAPKRRRTK